MYRKSYILIITLILVCSCHVHIARTLHNADHSFDLTHADVSSAIELTLISSLDSSSLSQSQESKANGDYTSREIVTHNGIATLEFKVSVSGALDYEYHMLLMTPELFIQSKGSLPDTLSHIAISGDTYSFIRDRQHYFLDVYKKRYRIRDLLDEEMEDVIINKTISTQYGESMIFDTTVRENNSLVYTYSYEYPLKQNEDRLYLTLKGDVLGANKFRYTFPPTDTLEYRLLNIGGFIDYTPRYQAQTKTVYDQYRIVFLNDKSDLNLTLDDNQGELDRVDTFLDSLLLGGDYVIDSLLITASASPIGKIAYNNALAGKRSETLYDHIVSRIGKQKAGKLIAVTSTGENWEDLIRLIGESTFPNKKKILNVIDYYFEHNKNLDGLEWFELRKFPEYSIIKEQLYPELRRVLFTYKLKLSSRALSSGITTALSSGVLDKNYASALKHLEDRDYGAASILLKQYKDQNYAICLLELNKNKPALEVLESLPWSKDVEALLRIVNSRLTPHSK